MNSLLPHVMIIVRRAGAKSVSKLSTLSLCSESALINYIGGYIIRYEHGKSKNTSVSFVGGSSLPSGETQPSRKLPYILAYPNNDRLPESLMKRDTSVSEGSVDDEAEAVGGDSGGQKQELDYISRFMGYVEVAFEQAASMDVSILKARSSAGSKLADLGASSSLLGAATAADSGQWRRFVDEDAFVDYFLGMRMSMPLPWPMLLT